jgi:hypothetical protein
MRYVFPAGEAFYRHVDDLPSAVREEVAIQVLLLV